MYNKEFKDLLIVDDQQMVVDGLVAILKEDNRFRITGINDPVQALALIQAKKTDLVITDIRMPGMSGIELTRKIKSLAPETKVLILSTYSDIEFVREVISAEAEGYLLKDSESLELKKAVNQIMGEGTYYTHKIVDLIKKIKNPDSSELKPEQLSEREKEVLSLIYKELSSAQIAEKLFISIHTVDTHRKNILKKTGTKTLVSLLKYGVQHQLISFED